MKDVIIDPLLRLIRQPAFVLCTMILALCAGGIHVGAEKMKLHFRKLPVPLQKSLDELDLSQLGPYQRLQASKISEEIEDELGTKEYIQWFMEDTSVKSNDPMRYFSLFITYYTGDTGKVPHVPDVCYVGGGGLVQGAENTHIIVPENGTDDDKLPIRVLGIEIKGQLGSEVRTVGYFFAVNGIYRSTRRGVQLLQNNVYDRYAYFSKVEVFFPGAAKSSREDILTAMEKVFQKIVPVLVEEHWPDWSELEAKEQLENKSDNETSTPAS